MSTHLLLLWHRFLCLIGWEKELKLEPISHCVLNPDGTYEIWVGVDTLWYAAAKDVDMFIEHFIDHYTHELLHGVLWNEEGISGLENEYAVKHLENRYWTPGEEQFYIDNYS